MCTETAISGDFDEAADPVSTVTTDMNIETLYYIQFEIQSCMAD